MGEITEATGPGDSAAFEQVVSELLEATHRVHPEHLVPLFTKQIARLGMLDAVVYIVDVDQRLLVPLGGGVPLVIDSTLGGRSFRSEVVLDGAADEDGPATNRRRLWVPIVDGAERVGVLAVTVDGPRDQVLDRVRALASLLAMLIVAKLPYGDALVCARRLRPMDLAAELRWDILPPLTYVNSRVAISGILEPAYEIAGDSFDYALNGDVAHLAILDAMGHGLEASRIANVTVGAYRNARRSGADLLGTFRAMDEVVPSQFGPDKFVTGHFATMDMTTGRMRVVNAGHPLPILLRGHAVVDIDLRPSLPIGVGGIPPTVEDLSLEPGDTILFFTDGVTEARSPDGDEFGRTRLTDLLVRTAAGETVAEVARKLCHAVLEHQGGRLQDDATLLLLTWPGPLPE